MISQLLRIEWLGETRAMFAPRFRSHTGEQILRTSKQLVPPTFGFELRERPRRKSFLLLLRKFLSFGYDLLEKLAHGL